MYTSCGKWAGFFGRSANSADDAEAGSFFIVWFICGVLSLGQLKTLKELIDSVISDAESIK